MEMAFLPPLLNAFKAEYRIIVGEWDCKLPARLGHMSLSVWSVIHAYVFFSSKWRDGRIILIESDMLNLFMQHTPLMEMQ